MEPDDEVCLCFHVTKRKIENYLRLEKPKRASQISECFGAGTGCGWCRPFLHRMFESTIEANLVEKQGAKETNPKHPLPVESELGDEVAVTDVDHLSAETYASLRANYVERGGGVPPKGS